MDYHNAIEHTIQITEPNSLITVYEGEFKIETTKGQIVIIGKVEFKWTPSIRVDFIGNTESNIGLIKETFDSKESCQITINGYLFGLCFLNRFRERYDNTLASLTVEVTGTMKNIAILGDRTIPVSCINFTIPNLRNIHGLPIEANNTPNKTIKRTLGRLCLENERFIFNIDKRFEYKDLSESLRSIGGFQILYYGELTAKKGNLTLENTSEIFGQLDAFLSFLNGRRTGALLKQGVHEGEVIWKEFSVVNIVDPYKYVPSWASKYSIEGINEMWNSFCNLCAKEIDKDFIMTAIHWYNEANSNSGRLEGAIIMAQTALELIYNWLIVEKRRMIIGKDAENISAANKIRLLLSQMSIEREVPGYMSNLKAHVSGSSELYDGPDALVSIRNSIIHSQEEKRRKLLLIDTQTKVEAMQLSIWYIEMSLLYILGFSSNYTNRCSMFTTSRLEEDIVPWTKVNKDNDSI